MKNMKEAINVEIIRFTPIIFFSGKLYENGLLLLLSISQLNLQLMGYMAIRRDTQICN